MIGTRRVYAYPYAHAVLVLLGGLLAFPMSAWGAHGGSALSPGSAGSGSSATADSGSIATAGSGSPATVARGNITVSAAGDGITLSSSASTMLSRGLSFSGMASPSAAGKTVEIQRLGHQTNWQWAPTATATVAGDGSFSALWTTNHIGRFAIRALLVRGDGSTAAAAAPTVTITVYRPSIASWYGGKSEWGRRTACGVVLRPTTIGVANRTLKCGTKVAFYYRGRTMIVPVIDRGPYANGADWDLTQAAGGALGMLTAGVVKLGAVSLPQQPALG